MLFTIHLYGANFGEFLGNEGTGLSWEIERQCDDWLFILSRNDEKNEQHALNVSVATGVLLFSLANKNFS